MDFERTLSTVLDRTPTTIGKIIPFPEFTQVYKYDCVACGMECILIAIGIKTNEKEIMHIAGTTSKYGTDPDGVFKVLRHFQVPYRAGSLMPRHLRDAIHNEHPVLLMLQAYRDNTNITYRNCWDDGHGVVCIGYVGSRFVFEDPASTTRTWLDESELLARWHDTDRHNRKLIHWGCEILRKPHFRPDKSTNKAVKMD